METAFTTDDVTDALGLAHTRRTDEEPESKDDHEAFWDVCVQSMVKTGRLVLTE